MTAKRILDSIVAASAADDSEDLEIRKVLKAELGLTIALCPSVVRDTVAPPAVDDNDAPGFCALMTDRRLTSACRSCLLGQVS